MLRVTEKRSLKVRAPPALSPRPSSCQRAARKVRKAYMRKIRQIEYRKLQAIVPSVASKEKVAKVTVIEEAIHYIDELHLALAKRMQLLPGATNSQQIDCTQIMNMLKPFMSMQHLPPMSVEHHIPQKDHCFTPRCDVSVEKLQQRRRS